MDRRKTVPMERGQECRTSDDRSPWEFLPARMELLLPRRRSLESPLSYHVSPSSVSSPACDDRDLHVAIS